MGAFEDHTGKISQSVFKEDVMNLCGADRKEVLCGPAFGVDTAIIDLGEGQSLAVSSDPLSLIPALGMEVSAWLSVHLLANDMSTTGFAPQYAQFVLNLPVSLSRQDFRDYWAHIHKICNNHGIAITGGHTGQVPGQESTISGGGTMFLKAPHHQIMTSNQAQPGDCIIVTKEVALSSTALLARAFPKMVRPKCGLDVQQQASENFWKLSVLKEGTTAAATLHPNSELHAMHDVTEGGVLGAINEMADASGCGFSVVVDKLPVSNEIRMVADLFEIDPFVSIGAGSMLMAVKKGHERILIEKLSDEGIPATVVGEFTEHGDKLLVDVHGESKIFKFNGVDPYWNAFYQALKTGWK